MAGGFRKRLVAGFPFIKDRKAAAAPLLTPFLQRRRAADGALVMLHYLVTQVADPRHAERLGVSRREAVRTAVEIWGGGALRERTRLRTVKRPKTIRRR